MKYIICAKEYRDGTSTDDIDSPLQVTEIATELVITRLYCIMLLQEGKISIKDTVVTSSDRRCLYSSIFENVMTFKEFRDEVWPEDEVIDLLVGNTFNSLAGGAVGSRKIPYLPKYQNWERDKDYITNITLNTLENYDVSKKFVCILIRLRKAWPEKNLGEAYWKELIQNLEDKGIKVFVFGKEVDKFATDKTQFIPSFQDWCSIINHENCQTVVSTISGGVYPVFICGHKGQNLIIIDHKDTVKKHAHDPSWYNDCINFTGVNKKLITKLPTVEELVEEINESI